MGWGGKGESLSRGLLSMVGDIWQCYLLVGVLGSGVGEEKVLEIQGISNEMEMDNSLGCYRVSERGIRGVFFLSGSYSGE